MAITLPGRDKVVATDTISGEDFQRVKAAIGGVGEASDLDYGQAAMAASLPVVIASDQSALTIGGSAADDAAAAGNPVPMGAVYQATVDEVDAGDIGRLRMTARRGLIVAQDFQFNQVTINNFATPGGIQCLTGEYTAENWVDPAAAFFDGSDVAFDAAPRYVRIPMEGFSQCTVAVYHTLGTAISLTVDLFPLWQGYTGGDGILSAALASVVAARTTTVMFSPQAGGAGAGSLLFPVPALQMPMKWLLLELTPSADPSSGYLLINVARS